MEDMASSRTDRGGDRIGGMGVRRHRRQPNPPPVNLASVREDRRPSRLPKIRLHDVRHTHGTHLIKAGVPVKVVSERLGHGNPTFTIDTYQHVLPGMQSEAARIFEKLIAGIR